MSSLRADIEPFPGYKLERYLGRGAWGEVWKAVSPDGKPMALKFISCSSQRAATKEIRAIQSVRNLNHPNIVKIFQIWGTSGFIVVAMELAEGTMLDLMQISMEEFKTPMSARNLCHYLTQAASALDFLNSRQHIINGTRVAVRHCDVKPSNLLVFGNTLKLSDFSLSVQSAATMTCCYKAGTLHYAAPEIFQGVLSERTDQFALAVTYTQLRSGIFPFPTVSTLFETVPQRSNPDLSALTFPEQEIIRRALHPTPQDRWPSCTEMMKRLSRVIANEDGK